MSARQRNRKKTRRIVKMLREKGFENNEIIEMFWFFTREQKRVSRANERTRKQHLKSDLNVFGWMRILVNNNFNCAYCGEKYTELDHIVPVCRGGGTTHRNVAPSCTICNRKKGAAVWL